MKRLIFLFPLVLCAQVQTVPNTTFPAVRALINSNFSWLNTNKSSTSHTHTGVYAPLSHVHIISDITSLQTALDAKVPTSTTVNGHALSGNVTVSADDVGLGSVDNTSDADKPISTAQQSAMDLKAPLADPNFTGKVSVGASCPDGATTGSVCALGKIFSGGIEVIAGSVAGPAGPVGPAGPSGSDGAPGVAGYSPNALLTGCQPVWTGSLSFTVPACTYQVGGTQYSSPQANVTLDSADGSNPRFDTIAVDTNSVAVVLKGSAAVAPVIPSVDPSSQVYLTSVSIPANAITPANVTNTLVFDENAGPTGEWTATKSGTPLSLSSTNNPYRGTVDIEGTSVVAGNYANFAAAAPFSPASVNYLVFYVRSKAAWNANRSLQIQLRLSAAAVGSIVSFKEGSFGFASATTTSYQQIVVPVSLFGSPASVDGLRITAAGSGGTMGFYLDSISLQAGLPSPSASTGLVWKGTWNSTAGYAVNDVVAYTAGPWVALVANTNSTPATLNTKWAALGSGSGGVWGSITGTLSSQTDLNTALGLKAPVASPTFTGTVSVSDPSNSGALDLTGKTSGNTVTISVSDTTGSGVLTAPGATGTIPYVTTPGAAGNIAVFGSDGIGIVDGGDAIATPSLVKLGKCVTGGSCTGLGSQASGSVTFSSIPGTYSDLVVSVIGRASGAVTTRSLYIEMNGDTTGADYSTGVNGAEYASGGGFGTSGGGTSVGLFIMNLPGTSAAAGFPMVGEVRLVGYANTAFYKRFSQYGGYAQSGVDDLMHWSTGTWKNSAAITSLTFTVASSDTFVAGSTVTLYGRN